MRGRVSWIAAAMAGSIVAALPLCVQAQDLAAPRCVGGAPGSATLIAQDACQQAYDVYQLIAPQLGLALAGGNATAGTGSVLGGLGHFSVGVRVNAFDGLFPNTSGGGYPVSTNGAQRRTLATKGQWFGAPTADAAIGLFKGFPLALTNVLGVDALISAEYVPTIHQNDFSLDPSSNFRFGYGARIGLLSESIAFPGVSFTWIERDLPTIDIGVNASADVGVNGSTIAISNMDVTTRAWRIVASKSLIAFSVAAGVGRDSYTQSATLTGTVNQFGASASQSLAARQSLGRTNFFGDFSINLPLLKIVFEAGDAVGGSVATFNSFAGGRADRSQVYGSFGLRLSR
jgi:hypothetical protein